MFEILAYSHAYLIAITGLLGLLVGSFLNVVIYRLPMMMATEWPAVSEAPKPLSLSLAHPRSFCPHCQTPIAAYDNIPVISFLWLRGRCRACQTPINWHYPVTEIVSCLLSMLCAWHFGYDESLLAALVFSWSLLTLAMIDSSHFILPDAITLPLIWSGLGLSLFDIFVDSHSSILGAIFGYGSLWLVYQIFKLITGKEGMGYGDFKLLAALGAWLGWQELPLIILLSSLSGSMLGGILMLNKRIGFGLAIPFGPFLALSGWLTMLFGEQLIGFYRNLTGL